MNKARKLLSFLIEASGDTQGDIQGDNVVPPAEDIADQLLTNLSKDLKVTKGEVEPVPDEFTAKFIAVDEDEVEDKTDLDFTDGGNHSAYPDFVPKGDYWFSKNKSEEGKVGICCHEFVEDMVLKHITGLGNYDFVHTAVADPVEAIVRWIYRKVNPGKEEALKKASPQVEKWVEFWSNLNEQYED